MAGSCCNEPQATCDSVLRPLVSLLVTVRKFQEGKGKHGEGCMNQWDIPVFSSSHHRAHHLTFLGFVFAHAQNGDPNNSYAKGWL